jgi:hypothetical protein
MDPFSMVVAIVFLGCGTGIVTNFINKAFGGRSKQAQLEAKMAQDRARMLELQLAEAQRHNDQLRTQLEWHTRMLETQDKLMNRLTDGSRSAESTIGSSR